jgi:hypothetical protein
MEIDLMDGLTEDEKSEIGPSVDTSEDDAREGKENAHLEGEEFTPEEKKPVEPEKKEEPKPEVKVEAPKVEPVQAPERFKIKLKLRGEELEKEYTPDQLRAKLQMGEDYPLKTAEIAKERDWYKAHKNIFESKEFSEWLSTQQAEGRFQPQPAKEQPKAEVYEYMRRTADSDFEEIRDEMRAYAAALPPDAQEILSSDYAIFNREYDRLAQVVRDRKQAKAAPAAPAQPTPEEKAALEKTIKEKERLKATAAVEKPGTAPMEADDSAKLKKLQKELRARIRSGDEDASAEYLRIFHGV